jgi:phosphoribosyl 1,2-cyclic phosphate phosphodiesterase
VPRIGNDWGDCDPAEPRNRRTRVAIVVEGADGSRILVDTPTDLRQQLLATEIDRIDGVVWTHDHADHTHRRSAPAAHGPWRADPGLCRR